MSKTKLLIINRSQFGYHTGTYYLCKYLLESFDITYIGIDKNQQRIALDGINIKYISGKGSLFIRGLRFILSSIIETRNRYNITFIRYFRGCSIIKIFNKKKSFIIDIRSGSVDKNNPRRKFKNKLMLFETFFFKYVSVVSESLANKLKIPNNKVHILPLGAEIINRKNKKVTEFKLLYIGHLNRNIYQTIIGFNKFYIRYKNKIKIEYLIIGEGSNKKKINNLIMSYDLDKIITLAGYIHNSELGEIFSSYNIGISYVPITDYFNFQPPTKTFEYLLAGMPVIATSTYENRKIINNENGILINDTPESFFFGLKKMYENRDRYNAQKITEEYSSYSWRNIAQNNFLPYLNKILLNSK